MEYICRHKFFGVQMEYKICKPFVGTINIMYSICRALFRYARNVTASPISLITAEGFLRQQRGRPPGTHGRFFVGWSPCVRCDKSQSQEQNGLFSNKYIIFYFIY